MTLDPPPTIPEPDPDRRTEALERHLARCRRRVPGFAARHLGLRGSLRLHRAALGWDVARAPVNILLGIANLACDLLGRLARRLGRPRTGAWLRSRHWVLRTEVMRRLDRALREDLLHWPPALPGGWDGADAPPPPELARTVDRLVRHYLASRIAMGEVAVALASTAIGWWLFGALAPGAIALSMPLADALALHQAVQDFPLGPALGGMWYGLFGAETPWPVTAGTAACLTALFALAAAFACLVTDPLDSLTGTHRRRLRRLLRAYGAALHGAADVRLPAHEHYLARLLDLLDMAQAAVRGLR